MIRLPAGHALAPVLVRARLPRVRRLYASIGGGSPQHDWTKRQAKAMVKELDANVRPPRRTGRTSHSATPRPATPKHTRYAAGQDVVVRRVTADSVVLGTALHDPVRQRLTAQQIMVTAEGIRMVPGVLRYAWPSELDLMARLAGLRLRKRWGGWRDEAFTAASARAISVYPPA